MILVVVAAAGHALYTYGLQRYVDPTYVFKNNEESFPRVVRVGKVAGSDIYVQSMLDMDRKYKSGFRHFLIGVNQTSDKAWVCMNMWGQGTKDIFPSYLGNIPMSLTEFQAATSRNGMKPCVLNEMMTWMQAHPDATLVVYNYADLNAFLAFLEANAGGFKDRIHLILNADNQVNVAKGKGFEHIYMNLTSFSGWKEDEPTLQRVLEVKPEGLIMQKDLLKSRIDLVKALWQENISVIANGVNDCENLKNVVDYGARGIYTDELSPSMCQ